MDSGELSRLYTSFYGLQLQLQGGGRGGRGIPFPGGFPYSKACGSGQTDGRPVHPFAFVSLRRQGFVSGVKL